MRTARVVIVIGLLAACCPVVTAGAEPQLDQSYTLGPTNPLSYQHAQPRWSTAQTFTVGLPGRLDRIDLPLYRLSTKVRLPLLIDVRQTTVGGAPLLADDPVLAAVSIAPAELPLFTSSGVDPFHSIDLSPFNIRVTPGDRLAIVYRSNEPDEFDRGYYWRTSNQGVDGYTRGATFNRENGVSGWQEWVGLTAYDASFKTYVTVPDPASVALVLLPAFAALLRRRASGGNASARAGREL